MARLSTVGEFVSVVGDPAWFRLPTLVSFDPTGDWVFFTNFDSGPVPKGVYAYRSDTGQLAWSRNVTPASISSKPAFDATGKVVLSCGPLLEFRLVCLAVASGEELFSIGPLGRLQSSPAFSPDGRLLAYRSFRPGSSTEGLVTVCDPADLGRERWSQPYGTWSANAAILGLSPPSFSFDSGLLGLPKQLGFPDQAITDVYRADSGDRVQSSSASPDFGGAFSADGSRLIRVEAPQGRPAVLRQFDIGTGRQVEQTAMNITGSATSWAGFSADRRLLAIRGERAAIFNFGATEPLFASMAPWQHPVQFSPGGSFYSSARTIEGGPTRVSLFLTHTGEEVWHTDITEYNHTRTTFSPDGRYFAVSGLSDMAGSSRRGVFIVRVGDPPIPLTSKFLGTVQLQKELPSEVTNVAVGPGVGTPFIATTKGRPFPDDGAGRELWVFGTGQGELRRQVPIRGVITRIDCPDDMSCVAVGSSDGVVRLFGTATGGGDWAGRHGGAVNAVAVAADGRLIATGGSDRRLRVYSRRLAAGESPNDHRPLWTSAPHARGIARIAMSSNGKWIATGCPDGSVQLFNTASPEPSWKLSTLARVTALDFASDKTLAVGLESGSVRVIDVASGQQLANLAHPAAVTAACFNWDGSLLATSTAVPVVVRVWRAAGLSERPLFSFDFETAVNDLVFCPVNNILIAALRAANVTVIDADTGSGGRQLFTGAATGVRFASDGSLLVVAAGARVTIYKAASTARTGPG